MSASSHFGTSIVATRSTKALAEKHIARNADALGATDYWDGSRSVPITLTWEPVKNSEGKWDVVATCTPRKA